MGDFKSIKDILASMYANLLNETPSDANAIDLFNSFEDDNPVGIPMSEEDISWGNDSELDNLMADLQDSPGQRYARDKLMNKWRKK